MKKLYIAVILIITTLSVNAQYVGEIRMFAGNFAPNGWLFCEGQLLSISENDALFSLIGTTYGGDGVETFALPDLRGRAPMHQGNGFYLGEMGGVESVTLTNSQIPSHTHTATFTMQVANSAGDANTPQGNVPAINSTRGNEFVTTSNESTGATISYTGPTITSVAGGSQPHDNMQPYIAVHYIISLYGVYPSQN
jgi:microcystin-dependent protein